MATKRAMKRTGLSSVTDAEHQLLLLVLREVRNVMSTGEQLSIIVDPWSLGGGAHVCFAYNGSGWSTSVEGPLRKGRKRRRAP